MTRLQRAVLPPRYALRMLIGLIQTRDGLGARKERVSVLSLTEVLLTLIFWPKDYDMGLCHVVSNWLWNR